MHWKRVWTALILSSAVVLLAVACGGDDGEETPTAAMDDIAMDDMAMDDTPEELDMATSKASEDGAFQVSVSSNMDPLVLNEIHSWTVHVETADGEFVENGQISVDGGMPEHNHGFPTTPEVTEELGGGDYLLDGVKFSMAGWWELKLDISAGDKTDSVTFNIVLP